MASLLLQAQKVRLECLGVSLGHWLVNGRAGFASEPFCSPGPGVPLPPDLTLCSPSPWDAPARSMHSPASMALATSACGQGASICSHSRPRSLQSQTTTAWVSARLRAQAQHSIVCHTHSTRELRPQAASRHCSASCPHHCGASQVKTRSVLPSNRPATPLFSPACWEPGPAGQHQPHVFHTTCGFSVCT